MLTALEPGPMTPTSILRLGLQLCCVVPLAGVCVVVALTAGAWGFELNAEDKKTRVRTYQQSSRISTPSLMLANRLGSRLIASMV